MWYNSIIICAFVAIVGKRRMVTDNKSRLVTGQLEGHGRTTVPLTMVYPLRSAVCAAGI